MPMRVKSDSLILVLIPMNGWSNSQGETTEDLKMGCGQVSTQHLYRLYVAVVC